MKRLVFSVVLAVWSLPGAFAAGASGSKGAASYGSAPGGSSGSGAGGMVSIRGSGDTMRRQDTRHAPPLAKERKVNEQDCTKPIDWTAGNLKCK